MDNIRDDSSRATIEVLAKRVGYLCCNPTCKRSTIGANEVTNKSTSIGIASHITAASVGGPRYDAKLTPEQRSHKDNGIWLCSNCATLIDKDQFKYSPKILKEWKDNAEDESRKKLSGELVNHFGGIPYLEVDLITRTVTRWSNGVSEKNNFEMHNGLRIMPSIPILYWTVHWNCNFIILNNSNFPAYNIKVEKIGPLDFIQFENLRKKNNLAPLNSFDLKLEYEEYIEGDYTVAEALQKSRIPKKFKDLSLKLTYYDDTRAIHTHYIEFCNGEIINTKV